MVCLMTVKIRMMKGCVAWTTRWSAMPASFVHSTETFPHRSGEEGAAEGENES